MTGRPPRAHLGTSLGPCLGLGLVIALLTGCGAGPATPQRETRLEPGSLGAESLRRELVQMARDDQVERTGDGLPPGTRLPPMQDHARAVRLAEVLDAHGWPTHALVGEEGSSAAWLVAQHADADVAFQERALALLQQAADAGEADVTEVAYLADRVAVNRDRPQRFGSQVRCRDGRPRPATPIEDPDGLEDRRRTAGMEPLSDYYAELAMMCADEAADGQQSGP